MFSRLFSRKNKQNVKAEKEKDILKESYLGFIENKKKQIELRVELKNNLQSMQMEMFKKNNNLVSPKEILFSGNENLYVSVPSFGGSSLYKVEKNLVSVSLVFIEFKKNGDCNSYSLGNRKTYSENSISDNLMFNRNPLDGIEAMFLSDKIQRMDKMELIWVNLDLIKYRAECR